jgi:nitroreductase
MTALRDSNKGIRMNDNVEQTCTASRDGDFAVFERIVAARWSCRAFRPEPVARETIETILRVAQKTPSWNNAQPWEVVVTSGRATDRFRTLMTELAKGGAPRDPDLAFPREYRDTYLARRRACGFQLYDAVGVERGDKAGYARQTLRNYELFDAPHVAIVTTDEALGVYGAVDCGAYVSNFMLAAQALGVATIAQAALALYSAPIRAHFAIPDTRHVVCGISFGWPDLDHPVNHYRTPRADIAEAARFVDDAGDAVE